MTPSIPVSVSPEPYDVKTADSARVLRHRVFRAEHDARSRRLEVAGEEGEQPGLLVEGVQDALQAVDVGELRLVEQPRGSVHVDAFLALAALERPAAELAGSLGDPVESGAFFLSSVDELAPDGVERQPAVLARQPLARRLELAASCTRLRSPAPARSRRRAR